jgi:hypothetical protein
MKSMQSFSTTTDDPLSSHLRHCLAPSRSKKVFQPIPGYKHRVDEVRIEVWDGNRGPGALVHEAEKILLKRGHLQIFHVVYWVG